MSNIEVSSLIKFFALYGLLLIILCFAAWKIAGLYHKYEQMMIEREKQFELTFIKVQNILQYEKPTEKRMNELLVLIRELENWDNSEKVKWIKGRFFQDYKPLSDELLSQDEFSPESTFKN
jgi:hypothetical protein